MMKEKSRAVQHMFGAIAGRYDLMNRLMTFGQDQKWRKCVVRMAALPAGGMLLDVGTGTGRVGQEALGTDPFMTVIGSDFAFEMMRVGRRRPNGRRMHWCGGDALHLPFKDDTFDAVSSGYLIRNVSDAKRAFAEQVRVVKPGGRVVCLDTSPPPHHPLRPLILFFLGRIIPLLGQIISGNRSAYTYLPQSTRAFYTPARLAQLMRAAGLADIAYRRYMFGTIAVHVGTKPRLL